MHVECCSTTVSTGDGSTKEQTPALASTQYIVFSHLQPHHPCPGGASDLPLDLGRFMTLLRCHMLELVYV